MSSRPFAKGHDPEDLTNALATNQEIAWRTIRLAGAAKLASPRLGLLPPPEVPGLGPCPEDDSAQTAVELIELAFAVRLMDVPWRSIRDTIQQIGNPLEGLGEVLQGPVRPVSVFRQADQTNPEPYVSQLLLLAIQAGGLRSEQRYRLRSGWYGYTPEAQEAMLAGRPIETQAFGPETYIHTPRALASAMHQDPPYKMGLDSAFLLDSLRVKRSTLFPPLPAEAGFTSYGGPAQLQCLIAAASDQAFRDCWQLKYSGHRRARPEELLSTPEVLHPLWHERGAALLAPYGGRFPLIIAEGSPMHSSRPSGHAATAGAEATVLMACYQDMAWPASLVQASFDGLSLIPTSSSSLTVHGELRRFAWNKGFGRCLLGVHYRSDVVAGLMVGQAAAIRVLKAAKAAALEPWGSTTFTGFDGQPVTI
jgi:hypothetical protein